MGYLVEPVSDRYSPSARSPPPSLPIFSRLSFNLAWRTQASQSLLRGPSARSWLGDFLCTLAFPRRLRLFGNHTRVVYHTLSRTASPHHWIASISFRFAEFRLDSRGPLFLFRLEASERPAPLALYLRFCWGETASLFCWSAGSLSLSLSLYRGPFSNWLFDCVCSCCLCPTVTVPPAEAIRGAQSEHRLAVHALEPVLFFRRRVSFLFFFFFFLDGVGSSLSFPSLRPLIYVRIISIFLRFADRTSPTGAVAGCTPRASLATSPTFLSVLFSLPVPAHVRIENCFVVRRQCRY